MKTTSLLLTALLSTGAFSAPLKIELPAEAPTLKAAAGVEIAMQNCLTCHSAEYMTTQPPLSRAAWKASVDKMKGKFGAQIPAEQIETLVDYLSKNYGQPNP